MTQHAFMVKKITKIMEIEGNFPNIVKVILYKPTTNIILQRKTKLYPTQIRFKIRLPTLITPIQCCVRITRKNLLQSLHKENILNNSIINTIFFGVCILQIMVGGGSHLALLIVHTQDCMEIVPAGIQELMHYQLDLLHIVIFGLTNKISDFPIQIFCFQYLLQYRII